MEEEDTEEEKEEEEEEEEVKEAALMAMAGRSVLHTQHKLCFAGFSVEHAWQTQGGGGRTGREEEDDDDANEEEAEEVAKGRRALQTAQSTAFASLKYVQATHEQGRIVTKLEEDDETEGEEKE